MMKMPSHAANRSLRRCEIIASMRSWQAEAPAPPLQASDLPVVAHAVSLANYISSQLLTVAALIGAIRVK
jgi:hypothetical protein